jgi:hypothetical protein
MSIRGTNIIIKGLKILRINYLGSVKLWLLEILTSLPLLCLLIFKLFMEPKSSDSLQQNIFLYKEKVEKVFISIEIILCIEIILKSKEIIEKV